MPLIDRNKNFENRQKSLNILKIWNFKKKPQKQSNNGCKEVWVGRIFSGLIGNCKQTIFFFILGLNILQNYRCVVTPRLLLQTAKISNATCTGDEMRTREKSFNRRNKTWSKWLKHGGHKSRFLQNLYPVALSQNFISHRARV